MSHHITRIGNRSNHHAMDDLGMHVHVVCVSRYSPNRAPPGCMEPVPARLARQRAVNERSTATNKRLTMMQVEAARCLDR